MKLPIYYTIDYLLILGDSSNTDYVFDTKDGCVRYKKSDYDTRPGVLAHRPLKSTCSLANVPLLPCFFGPIPSGFDLENVDDDQKLWIGKYTFNK